MDTSLRSNNLFCIIDLSPNVFGRVIYIPYLFLQRISRRFWIFPEKNFSLVDNSLWLNKLTCINMIVHYYFIIIKVLGNLKHQISLSCDELLITCLFKNQFIWHAEDIMQNWVHKRDVKKQIFLECFNFGFKLWKKAYQTSQYWQAMAGPEKQWWSMGKLEPIWFHSNFCASNLVLKVMTQAKNKAVSCFLCSDIVVVGTTGS